MRVLLVIAAVAAVALATPPIHTPTEITGFTKLSSWGNSSLYEIVAPDMDYDHAPLLIDLHGSRYDQGFAYGYLLADRVMYTYHAFISSILGDHWWDDIVAEPIFDVLDWQWNAYLSKQVPSEMMEELRGIEDGGKKAGQHKVGKTVTRVITLANAPGDLKDFVLILLREWDNRKGTTYMSTLGKRIEEHQGEFSGLQCSMFAVWGSRSDNGDLYSARNLDWSKDSGINRNKVIEVHHPPEAGKHAHACVAFAGMWAGATGMSAGGLSVHEANLEENEITFDGFPWVLRLRYVMENAQNVAEAKAIWERTNNTVGFNHMVASGNDAASGTGPAAVAMETMYQYTAYFNDNDPREAAATVVVQNPDHTNSTVHIGAPMPDAVWRTNHGYDPTIRKHYEWSDSPTSWTVERYFFIHDAIATYQTEDTKIGLAQAINITSIVGDKGKHAYDCQENRDGTNVISTTFHPQSSMMYVAWERSTGDTWRPACCSSYLAFDMSKWW